VDPILPAELSIDNIRGTRTRSDEAGERTNYAVFGFPPAKRQKNGSLIARSNFSQLSVNDGKQLNARPRSDADIPPPVRRPLASSSVQPLPHTKLGNSESDHGLIIGDSEVDKSMQAKPHDATARMSLKPWLFADLQPAPPPTPASLPSESQPADAFSDAAKFATEFVGPSTSRVLVSATPPARAYIRPPHQAATADHQGPVVDLTLDRGEPANYDTLRRYIEDNTMITFIPEDSSRRRIRAFAVCNTLNKFFRQAYQAGLFKQNGNLGRLLNVNFVRTNQPLGIAEGDEEDFKDFVRQLEKEPCWKMRGVGDCKVEVRLQML
jgi:hypothetical protein